MKAMAGGAKVIVSAFLVYLCHIAEVTTSTWSFATFEFSQLLFLEYLVNTLTLSSVNLEIAFKCCNQA